ncbi:MAG: hypothetical protein ILO42_00795 [Clostridia bacterium]|nr:hypothetical protein [Clostridia bacterium]
MKRAAALLIAALLLLFCACSETDVPDDGTMTGPPIETEPEGEPPMIVVSGSDGPATVVRGDKSSDFVATLTGKVGKAMKAVAPDTGVETDWIKNESEVEEKYGSRPEILIGSTNRPESEAAAEGLGTGEWKICSLSPKIVIAGNGELALEAACEAFASHIYELDGNIVYNGPTEGEAEVYRFIGTNQKQSRVDVYRLTLGEPGTVLEKSFSFSYYNIADARLRVIGEKTVLLATLGPSNAYVTDYETGKTLWTTSNTANNPHACEYIRVGDVDVIAVAATAGNEVRFYDMNDLSKQYVSLEFEDSHGALWDPELELLWIQGRKTLAGYRLSVDGGKISVEPAEGRTYTIPTDWAHDLQPYYGDTDKLWITTGQAVYLFSKSNGEFSTSFTGSNYISKQNVKGIGNFADGSAIFLIPDGDFKEWTGATVDSVMMRGNKVFHFRTAVKGAGFYKVRPFSTDYQ